MHTPQYRKDEYVLFTLQGELRQGFIQDVQTNDGTPHGHQGPTFEPVHVYTIGGVHVLEADIQGRCDRCFRAVPTVSCKGAIFQSSGRLPNSEHQVHEMPIHLCEDHFWGEIEIQKRETPQVPEGDLHHPMWIRLWGERDAIEQARLAPQK